MRARRGWTQMVKISLKGIHRDKWVLADGTKVEYHSIRGVKNSRYWKSTDDIKIGSPEYIQAYLVAKRPLTDTKKFGSVINAFFDSGEFRDLAPRTQKDYRRWGDEIRSKFASAPVSSIENPKIRAVAMKWRDRWDGRNSDYAWMVLGRILSWAVDAGKLTQHHLRHGKKRYKSSRAEVIWTEAEVREIEAIAPEYVARALRAAVETGLRPGDLVRLSRGHIKKSTKGRRITIRTNKRGKTATIPVTQEMARIIDASPPDRLLILVNQRGGQLTVDGLSHALASARDAVGVRKELRLYDARGSAVTRLVMADASLSEIALHMAWGLPTAAKMIEIYSTLDPDLSDSVLVKLDQIRNKIVE